MTDTFKNNNSLVLGAKDGSNGPTTLELASNSTTIHKDGVNNGTVAAGDVIEYKLNSDGKISEILNIYDVDRTTAYQKELKTTDSGNQATGIYGATVAISALAPTFQFSTDGTTVVTKTISSNNDYFELDKDTAYIYIENDDHSGAEAATILTADKDGSTMLMNAFVVFDNTDGKVKLVVYDTDNRIGEGTISTPVVNYDVTANGANLQLNGNSGDDSRVAITATVSNGVATFTATRSGVGNEFKANKTYTLTLSDGSSTPIQLPAVAGNGTLTQIFTYAPSANCTLTPTAIASANAN